MKVILPKTKVELNSDWPVFFLAGPVQGGDDWQQRCYIEIQKYLTFFYAVIPCRYPEDHILMQVAEKGINNFFERQTMWERFYLKIASIKGCIIFWLPCESKINPRKDGLPYAMDTRGELGEWRGQMMYNSEIKLVIGAEEKFPGLSSIQRNFNAFTTFPIYNSLENTVKAAMNKNNLWCY
jgi:hypothetical protein